MAPYVRAGLHFAPITGSHIAATDDSMELCGVRLLGPQNLDVLNIYRPPIRATGDDREDRFDPSLLPSDDTTIIVGDFNGHHPRWDSACVTADAVGERVAAWLEVVDWVPLNTGESTFASYRSGALTAPDLAACSSSLARRARWFIGRDLGNDHLPIVVEIGAASAPPRRIRKTRWAYKAEWAAFQADCERALSVPPVQPVTTQRLADQFEEALRSAAVRHIPRGARADPRPWALDPELQEGARDRSRTTSGDSSRRCRMAGNDRRQDGATLLRAPRRRSMSWWHTTSPVPTTWWTTDFSDSVFWSWDSRTAWWSGSGSGSETAGSESK